MPEAIDIAWLEVVVSEASTIRNAWAGRPR